MTKRSLYLLESVRLCYKDDEVGNEVLDINEDNEIRLYREKVGIFDSVENVESTIKELIRYDEKYKQHSSLWGYFGFLVDEHYLNDCLYGDDGNISGFESTRSYFSNGELNYFSDLDERGDKQYRGSDNPGKYIKSGDFVYCLLGHKLIPGIVDKIPMTKDEWKSRFKPDVYGDFFDDSGIVVTLDGHRHPMWTRVFPESRVENGKISENIKKKLIERMENYHKEIAL